MSKLHKFGAHHSKSSKHCCSKEPEKPAGSEAEKLPFLLQNSTNPSVGNDDMSKSSINVSIELGNAATSPTNDTADQSGSIRSRFVKEYLNIEGMSCGACSSAITKMLNSLDGIEAANVTLLLNRGEVLYDPKVTNLDDIIEEIEELGFGASELKMVKTVENSFDIRVNFRKLSLQTDSDRVKCIESIVEKAYQLPGVDGITNANESTEAKKTANISNKHHCGHCHGAENTGNDSCVLSISFDGEVKEGAETSSSYPSPYRFRGYISNKIESQLAKFLLAEGFIVVLEPDMVLPQIENNNRPVTRCCNPKDGHTIEFQSFHFPLV